MGASVWNPGSNTTQTTPASTQFQFIPGTAVAPGIAFVGDTNTGLFEPSVDILGIAVGGAEQLRVDALGNVDLVGKIAFSAEETLASAATCDIGAITSNLVQITGNVGITSFGTNYRGPMFLRFSGTPTIAPSTTLLTPGAASISVTAGDSCIVVPFATAGLWTGWEIVAYQKSSSSSSTGGSGATGSTGNYVFYEDDQTVTGDYTISNNKNAGTFGPVTINTGVTVTVQSGQTWSIV